MSLHCIVIIALILFFAIFYLESYDEGTKTFTLQSNQKFEISTKNCMISIKERKSDDKMKITHFIHNSIQPFKGDQGSKTNFELKNGDDGFQIVAESPFSDIKYCFLEIELPDGITDFSAFDVNCAEDAECYIAYKGNMRNFGDVNFQGSGDESVLSANFQSIKYNSLKFDVDNRGLLYLQNVEAVGSTDIDMNFGEVVIQSKDDFILDFNNPFQAVCMNAPNLVEISGSGKCDLTNESTVTPTAGSDQPYTDANDYGNWIDDDGVIQTRLPGCEGKYGLCKTSTCDSDAQTFNIKIKYSGNIYANYIENEGLPPGYDEEKKSFDENYQLFEGQIFQKGLNYSDSMIDEIQNFYSSDAAQTEPIWILDLGSKYTQLNSQTLWVKSTNPSFALMRPWWLATWSFSLLVTQTTKIEGYLQPGFCPYSTTLTLDQYWEIKSFIKESLPNSDNSTDISSTTFIQPNQRDTPTNHHTYNGGVSLFDLQERVDLETWYDIVNEKGTKTLDSYDQSDNVLILICLILSIFVSLIFVVISIIGIIYTLPVLQGRLAEISGQFDQYTSTISQNNEAINRQKQLQKEGQSALSLFISEKVEGKPPSHQPSFVASLDYYSFLETRKVSKSYKAFFNMLFQRANEDIEQKLINGEIDSEEVLEIKERPLKNLYEKFCFLNHLVETRLSDSEVVEYLEQQYNYTFVTDNSANQIFVKMTPKRKIIIQSSEDLKQGNSLENFINIYYDITGRETDDVWVEDVQQKYNEFCNEYRLVKVEFRAQQIKDQYQLELNTKTQLKLVMKKSQETNKNNKKVPQIQMQDYENQQDEENMQLFDNKSKNKKVKIQKNQDGGKYLIQQRQLSLHVDLMSDPGTYSDKFLKKLTLRKIWFNEVLDVFAKFIRKKPFIFFTNQEVAFMETIYGEMWMATDTRIVIQHFAINIVLLLPLFLFIWFNQTAYAPYSMNHPVNLFAQSDFKYSLVYIPLYIKNCEVTMLICLIVIFVFMIVQAINELWIYYCSKYPVDRAFEEEKKRGDRLSTKFQFIIMLVLIAFLVFYITMNLLWLMLGAIINPNYFLVYCTAVITLITFVTSKKKSFNELYNGGIEIIKDALLQEYTKKISGIMGAIEAEKNSLLNNVQNTVTSLKSTVNEVADHVGLGDETNAMFEEINQNFKSIDKMTIEDMDPQIIAKKALEQEQKIKQKIFQKMKKELEQVGFSEKLAEGVYSLVILNDQQSAAQTISSELARLSDEKLPEQLIIWIMETVMRGKSNANMINMSKDLQNSIIQIIIQNLMADASQDLKNQVRNLILLGMNMIQALQDNNINGIINIFKQILPLIPIKAGMDWSYSPMATFVLKFLELLMKMLNFNSDTDEMGDLVKQCFQLAQIPDDIGFFLTLVATQKNNTKFQYKNISIDSMDQLRTFIEDKIANKIQFSQTPDKTKSKYISYTFTTLFKLMRGDQDFNDEIDFISKCIQRELKSIIPVDIKSVQGKQYLQAYHQLMQNGIHLVKMIPSALKNQDDINQTIQKLSSETNFDQIHIRGIIASSTITACNKLKSLSGADFYSREKILIDDNKFLSDLANAFGLPNSFILGFMDLYHDKDDIRYDSDVVEYQYMEKFYQFIFQTLKVKNQLQEYLMRQIFSIMKARNVWTYLEEIQDVIKNPTLKKHWKNKGIMKKKILLETIINFLENGDLDQLKSFVGKSFAHLRLEEIKEYLQKLINSKHTEQYLQNLYKKEHAKFSKNKENLQKQRKEQDKKQKEQEKKEKKLKEQQEKKKVAQEKKQKQQQQQIQNTPNPEKKDDQETPAPQQENLAEKDRNSHSNNNQQGIQEQNENDMINENDDQLDEEQGDQPAESATRFKKQEDSQIYQSDQIPNTFEEFKKQFHFKYFKIIEDTFRKCHGDGKVSITQIKRKNMKKITLMEMTLQLFTDFGLYRNYQNLLLSLYKVSYLKIDPTGFERNDRLRVIGDCSKQLKISNQIISYLIAFQDISDDRSKSLIIEFYKNNTGILSQFNDDNKDKIDASCRQILETIEQLNQTNPKIFDDFYSKKQKKKNKSETNALSLITELIDQDTLFNGVFFQKFDLNKEQLSNIAISLLKFLTKQKIISEENSKKFADLYYSIFYMFDNFNVDFLQKFFKEEDQIKDKKSKQNINLMLSLFKSSFKGSKTEFIYDAKKVFLKLIKDKFGSETKEVTEFIFDLVATISIPQQEKKEYIPGKNAQQLYNFFPYLSYIFINDPQQFLPFAEQICKQLFKFDSISSKELSVIFSLFGETPLIDEASVLLQINTNILEIAYGMSHIICGKNKYQAIQQFTSQQGYKKMCQQASVNTEEIELLLKLGLKVFNLDDLEKFFDIFGMKQQIQIDTLKGLFAFLLPQQDKGYLTPIQQKNDYFKNYNSRKQLYKELQSSQIETISSKYQCKVIPEQEQYQILELYFNLSRGRFMNIEYQFQEQSVIKNMKIFGGSQFIRYSVLGALGYINQNQEIENLNKLSSTFTDFRKGIKSVQNNLQGALYLLDESILDKNNIFDSNEPEILQAFLSPQCDDSLYQIMKDMENDDEGIMEMSYVQTISCIYYLISKKLSYKTKINIIENNQINKYFEDIRNLAIVKQKDATAQFKEQYSEQYNKLYRYDSDYLKPKELCDIYDDMEAKNKGFTNQQKDECKALQYISEEILDYEIISFIFMATLQDMKKDKQDLSSKLQKEKNPNKILKIKETYMLKFVLDMDLVLNCISKSYVSPANPQNQYFRKNMLLELLTEVYHPVTSQIRNQTRCSLFTNIFNKIIPSNPSCYIEQKLSQTYKFTPEEVKSNEEYRIYSKEFQIFHTFLYEQQKNAQKPDEEDLIPAKIQLENVKKFFNTYKKVYLDPQRFKILDDLEQKISNLTKSGQQIPGEEKVNAKSDKPFYTTIQLKKELTAKQCSKQSGKLKYKYGNYQELLEKRKAIYKVEMTEQKEQKYQYEAKKIFQKNIEEHIQCLLNLQLGITQTVEKLHNKVSGLLGNKQTKQLIQFILLLQQEENMSKNFILVKNILKKLGTLRSNAVNVELFLETVFSPDKDELQIKQFISTFIDIKFYNQFMGIFLIKLIQCDKFNLSKYSALQAQKEYEDDPEFKKLDEEKKMKKIQEYQKQIYRDVLDNSIGQLLAKLQISPVQIRVLNNILQCFAGEIDSWLLLFSQNIQLFDKSNKKINNIGSKFLYTIFSYIDQLKQLNKQKIYSSIKSQQNQSLKQCLDQISELNEITREVNIIEKFIKNAQFVKIPGIDKDQQNQINKLFIEVIEDEYWEPQEIINIIFLELQLVDEIPMAYQEFLEIIGGRNIIKIFKDPSTLTQGHKRVSEEIQEISASLIQSTFKENDTLKKIFKFFIDCVCKINSKNPILVLGTEIIYLIHELKKDEYKDDQNKLQQLDDILIMITGGMSLQICGNLDKLNDAQSLILQFFGTKMLEKFQKTSKSDKDPLKIIQILENKLFEKFDFSGSSSFQNELLKTPEKNQQQSLISNFDKIKNQFCLNMQNLCGIDQKENENPDETKKQAYEQLIQAIEPFKNIWEGLQDKFIDDYQDEQLSSLFKLIKLMFYQFSGLVSNEEGSEAWQMITYGDHLSGLENLALMLSGEEDIDDVDTILRYGLPIIGDLIFVGFDILKNKNSFSIRDLITKYQDQIYFYFDDLQSIIFELVDNEETKNLITLVTQILQEIIDEEGTDEDSVQKKGIELLHLMRPIFEQVVCKSFNMNEKTLESFNNNQQQYEKFCNDRDEYNKFKKDLIQIQSDLKTFKKQLNSLKTQKKNIDTQLLDQKLEQPVRDDLTKQLEKINTQIEEANESLEKLTEDLQLNLKDSAEKFQQIIAQDSKIGGIIDVVGNIVKKTTDIQQVYKNKLEPLIEDFKVNGYDNDVFVNQFIPVVVQLVSSQLDSSSEVFIVNITNSLIALINCKFNQIHDDLFKLMRLNDQEISNIRDILTLFNTQGKSPLQMLKDKKEETLGFIHKKSNDPSFNQFNKIKEKMEETGIQPRDMFKLADIDGGGTIDMREFQLYFKKIGIELSDHRVQEIFAQVKQGSPAQQSTDQTLNEEEFIKAYEYVQNQSMFLTLEKMGITKSRLVFLLVILTILLVLIFVFIFIGVSAFAIPGTFGAIVNSAFPVLGGTGVSKSNQSDPAKTLNIKKIKKTVSDALATIQNSGI